MQGVGRFLDEPDPCERGPGSEPQLDQVIPPIAAVPGEGLDRRDAASGPDRDEAAGVKRATGLA